MHCALNLALLQKLLSRGGWSSERSVSGKRQRSFSCFSRTDATLVQLSLAAVAMASTLRSALSVILCALALILCSCPAEAQQDLALDCCLTVSHKIIPKQIVLTYRKQFKVDGCPRDAVVFQTRKSLYLCAPPAEEELWVKDLIKFLDIRLRKCRETKFQEKRCQGLRNLSF
ncbi:C-C motif chemokine 19a.1 [Labeo rohita]|uniref:C-C motif chemokine 19a.1 n=1 Tax=Labeo rohita TaxID=84645 RepID=UPI0021E2B604|nr:C-C motif chemokine 19a.1 [Labeo rohita]